MRVRDLSQDEMIAPGLEFQRELSMAESGGEMLLLALRGIARFTGATHIIAVVRDPADPGTWALRDTIWLADPGLSAATVDAVGDMSNLERIEPGTPLHELVRDRAPKIAEGVDSAADPLLAPRLDGASTAMVVPLTFDGEVREWAVVWWPEGAEVTQFDARIAVSNLNLLVRSLEQMRMRAEIAELHDRLDAELGEVAAVQRSLLPAALPTAPGWEFAAHYEPSAAAGGDYYDHRLFADGRLGLVVADVSGHGAGAAVVMAMMRTAMAANRLASEGPHDVVRHVNSILYDGLRPGTFVTALFIALDTETGACTQASAGHPAPRLVRAGSNAVETPEANTCIPLGIMPDTDAAGDPTGFTLGPGDRMLLFTDGINEARSPGGELFGMDRLDGVLAAGDPDEPAEATLERIMSAVRAHEAGEPRADDQCALLARRLP